MTLKSPENSCKIFFISLICPQCINIVHSTDVVFCLLSYKLISKVLVWISQMSNSQSSCCVHLVIKSSCRLDYTRAEPRLWSRVWTSWTGSSSPVVKRRVSWFENLRVSSLQWFCWRLRVMTFSVGWQPSVRSQFLWDWGHCSQPEMGQAPPPGGGRTFTSGGGV